MAKAPEYWHRKDQYSDDSRIWLADIWIPTEYQTYKKCFYCKSVFTCGTQLLFFPQKKRFSSIPIMIPFWLIFKPFGKKQKFVPQAFLKQVVNLSCCLCFQVLLEKCPKSRNSSSRVDYCIIALPVLKRWETLTQCSG